MLDRKSLDVKIGISKHPEKRLGQIATTYNVGRVELLKTTWFLSREDAQRWEANFHNRYALKLSPARGGREWFKLTKAEITFFIDWMERSTDKRAFKAFMVKTKVWKCTEELNSQRRNAFWAGSLLSLMTGCIPAATYALTNQPITALAASGGIGLICSARTKKDKEISRTYDENGRPIPPELPERELRIMGLWKEELITIPDYTINQGEGLPDSFPVAA
ncbi:GIY-YIG nuclease family protein [Cyanobium sp. HWJ4-Hawea]|uniref:GIY-YIG nuclease family protein n=1 Tax=Cyanobium sp. HWJ4-Hawea TaxID=2823713 RepID=UPI0020CE3E21|nr:GIY-YIG nuclease family protein [Cyanobium sp. HWJ4-Hawea]MCP9810265.1 GIY-YIG nuclease family protein [Cyanobium sp. HWJ4-Hawea]